MQSSPRFPEHPITVAVLSRDRVYRDSLTASLGRRGVVVRDVQPAGEAPPASLADVDVLVLDTDSLTASELEQAAELQSDHPLVEVVAVAGDSSVAEAVKALRAGVFTVLQHPVADDTMMEALLAAGRRHRHARERLAELNGAGHERRRGARDESAPIVADRRGRGRS